MKIQNKNYILHCLFAFLVSLAVFACSDKSKDFNFTVKGSLSNLDSPFFYIATEAGDSISVDTIFVDKKGEFSYKGKVDALTTASLYFNKKSWSISIFLNKGWDVEIKGNVNRPDLIMVNGGSINDDLTSFKKNNADLFNSKANILQSIHDAGSTEITQNLIADLKNVNFELTNRARTYVEKNPDKIASVILLQDFYKSNTSIETLDHELNLLKGDAADCPLAQELRNYSESVKRSQVGALAPPISLKNDEKTFTLASLKGKYVFLTLASRDLNIYQAEVSAMMKSYSSLKNKNVEFVSIILDSQKDRQMPDSIKWKVFFDAKGWASDIIKDYNITEIPYSLFISPDGYILDRGISVIVLPEKVEELQKLKK